MSISMQSYAIVCVSVCMHYVVLSCLLNSRYFLFDRDEFPSGKYKYIFSHLIFVNLINLIKIITGAKTVIEQVQE